MKNQVQLIEKIRKLLNLAKSNNENEAQSAMLMAQKLMAQHDIEMSQVEDAPVDHSVLEEEADKKRHRTKWKRALAECIAHNFKCDLFYRCPDTYSTIFVGKKETLEICKTVYQSAISFIDFNFANWWNSTGKYQVSAYDRLFMGWTELPLSHSIKLKDSYARGFIATLQRKFEKQKAEAEKEGWGLVLVKDSDVVAYMDNKKASFTGTMSSGASDIDADAYSQGKYDCDSKFGETGQKKIGG